VYFTVPYALSWSVLEAMACGAAVVGSANPPVTELIHEGKTGRLVPFHDHEQLSTVLLDLLGDAQARTQLGQAGRRSVAQRYNLTDSVTAYEQLIHSLRLVRPATHG
jgi:glycosyltransferase involved in cell wall biosynthesis